MAMSVVYTTFGGMLIHENRGGTERQYISDPLGSLVGELDSTQAVTYTAEYWPYGEIQTETGTNTSNWSFVGLLGYLKDLASLLYVRARHYLPQKARWLTVDPFWPGLRKFEYCNNSPVKYVDILGLDAIPWPTPGEIPGWLKEILEKLGGLAGLVLGGTLGAILSELLAGAATLLLLLIVAIILAHSCRELSDLKTKYCSGPPCSCPSATPTKAECAAFELNFLYKLACIAGRLGIIIVCKIIPNKDHLEQLAGNVRQAQKCLSCASKCDWYRERGFLDMCY